MVFVLNYFMTDIAHIVYGYAYEKHGLQVIEK